MFCSVQFDDSIQSKINYNHKIVT